MSDNEIVHGRAVCDNFRMGGETQTKQFTLEYETTVSMN